MLECAGIASDLFIESMLTTLPSQSLIRQRSSRNAALLNLGHLRTTRDYLMYETRCIRPDMFSRHGKPTEMVHKVYITHTAV